MNKEIELKARVDKPEETRLELERLFGIGKVISKSDVYFRQPSEQMVRLRTEENGCCVTVKRKQLSGGTEINDELEFHVDDPEAFAVFMKISGAEKLYRKSKKGWSYESAEAEGNAVIELCEVSDLGWFLEIEIVIKNEEITEEIIEGAKKALYRLLAAAGIPERMIETRFYSEMIMEKKTRPVQRTGREKEVD